MSQGPLRSPRLQKKPKAFKRAKSFVDRARVGDNATLEAELYEIIDAVEKGAGLAERFYRVSAGQDRLLEEKGVIHVHLGGPGSDVIVYLAQYDDVVWLLATGSHQEMEADSRNYWSRHDAALAFANRESVASRAKRDAERLRQQDEQMKATEMQLKASLAALNKASKLKR